MTVKEMHIGINLLLQKINSNYTNSFEPQELDWALNEEVIRFIKQRISPSDDTKYKGFESSQKRFDDLKALIVTQTELPLYLRDKDSVFTYLPANYLTLINDRTNTKDLCGIPYSLVNTSNINKYIIPLKLKDSLNLYATLKIRINGIQIFDIIDYPPFATGLKSLSSKFELTNLLIQVLTDAGFDCKYNNYYDNTYSQGIIIVSDTILIMSIEYTPIDIVTINSTVKSYTKVLPVINANDSPNRLTSTEYLYNLLDTSFGNTIVSNPLSTLENDKLIVFHKQKFIASTVNISYIRKPRKISLSLNQDCDLDEWIQLEIVDNTAKRLAGIIGSQFYKEIINENLLKE